MIAAVKIAKEKGCVLHIVSDANTFFIEAILESYKQTSFFTEIHTNPARFDETGRLLIERYHNNHKREAKYLYEGHEKLVSIHDCVKCNVNICKGKILRNLREKYPQKKIIYIGDGSGDYCAATELTEEEFLLVRVGEDLKNGFGLEKVIEKKQGVKANIQKWNDAKQVLQIFEKILSVQN